MHVRLATALIVLVAGVLGACGGGTETEPAGVGFDLAETLELRGTSGGVEITIEVADSPAERERGLSGRPSLEPEQGMLFVNEQDVRVGYHMKDTTIPLSLAFVGADGAIIEIADMDPCAADPCPVYEPPAEYRYGLEVNQGAFERWGIAAGDRLVLPEQP